MAQHKYDNAITHAIKMPGLKLVPTCQSPW